MKKLLLSLSVLAMSYTAIAETQNTYTLASEIVSGSKYMIAANADGTYKAAYALSASKSYGYISAHDETAVEGVISTTEDDVDWTITAVEGGYTIQDCSGRYLYQTGSYNSFNVSADMPETGAVWTIAIADGNATITNTAVSKYIQYSTNYSSYGSYSGESGVLPQLFVYSGTKEVEDETEPSDPEPSEPAVVEAITIAKFLELADANTTYQLTGVVSNIVSTTYGNFDLTDETGTIYIYGLLNAAGESKQFESMDIVAGDTLTLQGKYYWYEKGSMAEISNAQYISHTHAANVTPDPDPEPTPDPYVATGDGSLTNAYTVADVIGLYVAGDTIANVWIKGTIIGAANGSTLDNIETETAINTNIILSDENGNIVPVQLPKGDVRNGLNLVDNPSLVNQTVWVKGSIIKYFNVAGVKSTSDYSLDGVEPNAIRKVKDETTAKTFDPKTAVIYNICGKRVSDMSKKGIYIVNGKKFVVK